MKIYEERDMNKAFIAGMDYYKNKYTENGGMFSEILHPKFSQWIKKYKEKKQLNKKNI